jgi:hypothetical protein
MFSTAAALLLAACLAAPAHAQTYTEVTGSIWAQGFDEESPCLVDIDGDGLLDLLLGTARGNILRYEQRSAGTLDFALQERDFLALYGRESETRPEAADLDGNGLIDLLIGCNAGHFRHYEQTAAGSYDFRLRAEKFNAIDVGAHSGCAIADRDGDGRLELIATESSSPLHVYRQNTPGDTLFTEISAPAYPGIDSYPELLVRDLDGDGLLDMLISHNSGTILHLRQAAAASDSFTVVTDAFGGITGTRHTAMESADINGDGRLELLLAWPTGRIEVRRQAAANSMDYGEVLTDNLLGSAENGFYGGTVVGDIDGDGLLDLVSSQPTYYGPPRSLVRFEQTAPNSTDFAFADSLAGVLCTRFFEPAVVDVDGNGRMDILLGTSQATVERYEQSAPGSTSFSLVSSMFGGVDLTGNSVYVSVADFDADGMLDFVFTPSGGIAAHYEQASPHDTALVLRSANFGSFYYYAHPVFVKDAPGELYSMYVGLFDGSITRFEQDAAGASTFSQKRINWAGIKAYATAQPSFADVNGDGRKDLILGDHGCGVRLFLADPEVGADPLPERAGALVASCHPNPGAGRTVITARGRGCAPVDLAVHDMLGRTVYESTATMPPSGLCAFTMDAGLLAPGSYLYVVRSAAERASGIMIRR